MRARKTATKEGRLFPARSALLDHDLVDAVRVSRLDELVDVCTLPRVAELLLGTAQILEGPSKKPKETSSFSSSKFRTVYKLTHPAG